MPSDLKLSVQSVTPDVTLTLSDPYIGSAYSPTVDVTEIEGGHRVTITSKGPDGIKPDEFDVLDGEDGLRGPKGDTGPRGEPGVKGDKGDKGDTGATGAQGPKGDKGDKGDTGPTGPQGPKGDTGATGATGPQGPQGIQGPQGEQGPAGEDYVITSADYAEIAQQVESDIQPTIDAAQDAADDATAAAAEARAASAATWLSGNVLFGNLAEGTVLTADDTYAAPPKSVDVYGVSTQASYTGKNLLNMAGYLIALNNDLYEPTQARYISEANGVYTFHSDSNDVGFDAPLGYLEAGTYRFSYVSIDSQIAAYLIKYNDGFEPGQGKRGTNRPTVYANTPVEITEAGYYGICFYVVGINNKTVTKPQVELGSTATSYEPYTGGKAAPNPDYPQEIKSVDDLTLHVCGKNLFDYPTEPFTNTAASVYNGYYFSGGFRPIPDGVDTITASMYIDNSAATDSSALTVWAHNSNGAVVAIGSALISASSTGRVSKTYDVSNYSDFALGGLIRPGATVSQLMAELGSIATAYEPYVGTSIPISLSNHIVRSLPDGTRDTLTLSYIGPSTREGWGVYSKTLVQRCDEVDLGTLTWIKDTAANYQTFRLDFTGYGVFNTSVLCTNYVHSTVTYGPNMPDNSIAITNSLETPLLRIKDTAAYAQYDAAGFESYVSGVKLVYRLATPITHDLGTIELPVNPVPNLTAWADGGSAQPTMAMTYEQDINIVIGELRSAIADMATS